eukprot:4365532-Karenia_brevis.AAC.1
MKYGEPQIKRVDMIDQIEQRDTQAGVKVETVVVVQAGVEEGGQSIFGIQETEPDAAGGIKQLNKDSLTADDWLSNGIMLGRRSGQPKGHPWRPN